MVKADRKEAFEGKEEQISNHKVHFIS